MKGNKYRYMLVISHLLHKSECEVSINRNKKHIISSTLNKVSIFATINQDMFSPKMTTDGYNFQNLY